MTTFISFIIVLGVLIFIHELGHFAMAKFFGVGVEKFSLGFGPKIVGFKKGETEYMICLLPLGGYVKMVGESPGEEISPELRKKSFTHQRPAKRAAIVAAGPIMNLFLAFILLPVMFMMGTYIPAYLERPAAVGYVFPEGPAKRAGITRGDVIKKLDGTEIKNWETLFTTVAMHANEPLKVVVERDGKTVETTVVPARDESGLTSIGVLPPMPPVIGGLSPGYPAEKAGLKAGDRIVAIDGKRISHWLELESAINGKNGGPLTFTVERDGRLVDIRVKPRYNKTAKKYLVGITRREERVFRSYGFVESIGKGLGASWEMTTKLFEVIGGLIVGKYSLKTLGGPIMIAQVAGRAAKEGLVDLISLVAFLSLQLGIINLFPIPVLDGGHILFMAIEAVKGRPLSERFMGIAQQIGIALIITLMILVTYNDIFRLLR